MRRWKTRKYPDKKWDGFIDVDNLYYMAVNTLNMTDEIFWDSSLRFLSKQFDIHNKNIEEANKRNNTKANNENTGEKTKLKVLSQKEIDEIMQKNK